MTWDPGELDNLRVTVATAADGKQACAHACTVVSVLANNQISVVGKRPDMTIGSVWMASSAIVTPRHWRVATISDQGKGSYEILASEYHEEKYAYVDQGVLIAPPPFSLIPSGPLLPPTDLIHTEYIYLDGSGTPQFGCVLSWQPSADPRVRHYTLELSGPAGDYRRFTHLATIAQDVPAMRQGQWLAVLVGFDNLGRRASQVTYNFTPIGLSATPLPPSAVFLTPQAGTLTIAWTPTGEIDVMFWWIKWSPLTDGSATWGQATTSIARVPRETTQVTTPTRTGTYMVKAIDSLGQESDVPAVSILTAQLTDRVRSLATRVAEQPGLHAIVSCCTDAWPRLELILGGLTHRARVIHASRLSRAIGGFSVQRDPTTRVDIYAFRPRSISGIVCRGPRWPPWRCAHARACPASCLATPVPLASNTTRL